MNNKKITIIILGLITALLSIITVFLWFKYGLKDYIWCLIILTAIILLITLILNSEEKFTTNEKQHF